MLQENRERDVEFGDEKGNKNVNSVLGEYGRMRQTNVSVQTRLRYMPL
jgi:hypothetical protein